MNRCLLPTLALALLSTGCDPQAPTDTTPAGRTAASPSGPESASAPPPPSAPPSASDSAASQPLLAAPSPEELKALAKTGNAFAFDLYGKLRSEGGDVAVSPLSVMTALTMTWAGAKGDTAGEMMKVLHTAGAADQSVDVCGKLLSSLADPSNKATLRVANRLFGAKAYTFEKSFVDHTAAAFGAPIETVDFAKDPEASRAHINEWVLGQTNQRIKNLLPANSVQSDTRLVLTNAIYFLGDWAQPFDKNATSRAPFHVSKTSAHDVATMKQEKHFGFAATDGVKILELPYEGAALAMTFVLPDAVDGVGAVEAKLSQATFDKWVGALASQKVDVALPKFTVDPAAPLELSRPLKALGMSLAFDRDKADFTGIANPPKPEDRLFVAKVFHKAFVKVDEKGTEAAAASAVMMAKAGAAMVPETPKEFHADHPFLFFLRDTRSNMILFMGRVADPK